MLRKFQISSIINDKLKFCYLLKHKPKFFCNKNSTDYDIDVKIKEPIQFIPEQDTRDTSSNKNFLSTYEDISKFNDDLIDDFDFNQLITLMKSILERSETNPYYDKWYKILDKFNDMLCSHNINKSEMLQFLEVLNFFLPKVLEKKEVPSILTNTHAKIAISQKHQEEYYRIMAPRDAITAIALFFKKHVKRNVIQQLFTDKEKFEYSENTQETLTDLIGLYQIVFKNVELKILDDIQKGRAQYSTEDCVKFIQSFSRSQEGTNLLYELMMRKICKHLDLLTLSQIEIVLNYLPHDLYDNDELLNDNEGERGNVIEKGRTKEVTEFYNFAFKKISTELNKVNDELFMNLFQGILKIKFVSVDMIEIFLNNFDERIQQEKKNKKFYFDFMQILAYFLKIDENERYRKLINCDILWEVIEDPFIKAYMNTFSLKEVTTIFWLCFHFGILTKEKINLFEKPIETILLTYINDPKSKMDTMGYETHRRYYDNYGIEQSDLEMIQYLLDKELKFPSTLLKLIKKALKCIELENTHPISRKWYHF